MAKEFTLKNVRLSYAYLSKPVKYVQGQGNVEDETDGVYKTDLIIPKDSEAYKILMDAIKELKSEALTSGIRAAGGKTVKVANKDMARYYDGIKDGDTKEDDIYTNSIIISAKSSAEYKPQLYNEAVEREEDTRFYSGCYANVYVKAYNYQAATNLGCAFRLSMLQFAADGDRLGSSAADATSIFGAKKSTDDMF